jgi:NAD(P)-dependent dehydrogenase (short-subunit alcohol dehydrogenase family)
MARVLITGCSTGIGRATADALTGRGHEVVATARNLSTLDGLDVAQRVALDVDEAGSIEVAMSVVGEVDVLVNNAGVGLVGPLESYPLDLAGAVFATNVFGPLRLIQAVLPSMRERGTGVIVNVSSVEGVVSTPLSGVYAASKHALEALSESLHFEVGHFGVRVVIIEPGYIATAMRTKASPIDIDATPYAELHRQWTGTDEKVLGGPRPGPEVVADAIAAAIDDPDTPLRVPVGHDAMMVTATRKQLDDATFESTMRSTLQIDW